MSKRVFVTGLGTISSIGQDVASTLQSLQNEKSGIGEIQYIETIHKGKIPVAEVKFSNEELLNLLEMSVQSQWTRTSLLGILGAQEAIKMADWSKNILSSPKTGIVSATSVGGMDRSEQFHDAYHKNHNAKGVEILLSHECASSTENIADFLGIKGFLSTISTACSSSANAIMFGARLIKHGILDRVLVGGVDALTRFTLNGFNTLQILDGKFCQPFDQNRRGLNLGEGAGFLTLEAEGIASPENILAELTGYANTNDAYHQTASSPEGKGAFMAMQKALTVAKLQPKDINYVNVHGTGTANNDLSEGVAMKRLFGAKLPLFSSTKSYTGHTLAAAGSLEAVISILSIQNKMVFPNLRFQNPIEELAISPVSNMLSNLNLKHVLSNSFGFGGNSSSLVFSRV